MQSTRHQLTDICYIGRVGFCDCDECQGTPVITEAAEETNFPAWTRLAMHEMAI